MKKKFAISLIISVILLVFLFILALMVGKYSMSISDVFKSLFTRDESLETNRSIIMNLRLPRTLMACLTGIALSISGLLYQEVFQNKLTSPDLLGVSTGASVGAAIAIIIGLSSVLVSLFAFVFGIITVLITVLLSKLFKGKSSINLILAGIIVGGFMSGLLSLVKYFADPATTLAQITYWLLGSFENSKMNQIYVMGPIVGASLIVLLVISWNINILSLGKERAQTRGLNYNFYKYLIIVISTLLTAASVAFCGTISWVGLVIPHIVRLITGRETKRSIPLCMTFGATFMIAVDMISRSFTESEIPLSAVTGIFGTVVFIVILVIRRREIHVD